MKKGGFKKKFDLKVDCEEDSNLASSIYSEIGPDGLRFLKYDIKVSKHGLTQESASYQSQRSNFRLEDIESSGKKIGRGTAAQVEEGVYKPLGIKVAIKVFIVFFKNKK